MPGLLINGLSLTELLIPAPAFGWKDAPGLFGTVVSAKNGLAIFEQFAFTYAVALIGTALTGKLLRATLLGFPVVFGPTLLALVLAGNKTMKELTSKLLFLVSASPWQWAIWFGPRLLGFLIK